jgi:hypothetical protein
MYDTVPMYVSTMTQPRNKEAVIIGIRLGLRTVLVAYISVHQCSYRRTTGRLPVLARTSI